MNRTCHRCGTPVTLPGRVGRRDACQSCGADLHCCLNCRFYAPTHHNACEETQAERQVDKAAGNFCDFFAFRDRSPRPAAATPAADTRARLDALFARKPSGR